MKRHISEEDDLSVVMGKQIKDFSRVLIWEEILSRQ